jgi:hypothetical protein
MSSRLNNLIERYPALEECQSDIQEAFNLLATTFRKDGKLLALREWRQRGGFGALGWRNAQGLCPF